MTNRAGQLLADLVARKGADLCSPARQPELGALLKDHLKEDFGKFRPQVFALGAAQKTAVPAEMLINRERPSAQRLGALASRLCERTGLSEDLARWAVESWALALGKIKAGELVEQAPRVPVEKKWKLDDEPRRVLCRWMEQNPGEDPYSVEGDGNLEARLRDAGSSYEVERFVLEAAQKQGVTRTLVDVPPGLDKEIVLAQAGRRLSDSTGLAKAPANWAVLTWALALGTITPEELSALEGEQEGKRTGPVKSRRAPALVAVGALAIVVVAGLFFLFFRDRLSGHTDPTELAKKQAQMVAQMDLGTQSELAQRWAGAASAYLAAARIAKQLGQEQPRKEAQDDAGFAQAMDEGERDRAKGDAEAARVQAEKGLTLRPGSVAAVSLRTWAQDKISATQKQTQEDDQKRAAEQAEQHQNWADAARAYGEAARLAGELGQQDESRRAQANADFSKAMREGADARKYGDAEAVSVHARAALGLRPGQREASDLLSWAQFRLIPAHKQEEMDRQIALASQAEGSRNWPDALSAYAKAAALAAELGRVDQRQKAQANADFARAMDDGERALARGDSEGAKVLAGKALALRANDLAAKSLVSRAEGQMRQKEQQAELSTQLRVATEAESNQKWSDAASAYEAAATLAVNLNLEAQRQPAKNNAAFARAMDEGRRARVNEDAAAAKTQAERALALRPGDSHANELLTWAADQISLSEKRQDLANVERQAAAADQSSRWTEASTAYLRAAELASQLALESQRQTAQANAAFARAMAQGEDYMSGQGWESAKERAQAALQIRSQDQRAQDLVRRAQAKLDIKNDPTVGALAKCRDYLRQLEGAGNSLNPGSVKKRIQDWKKWGKDNESLLKKSDQLDQAYKQLLRELNKKLPHEG